MSIPSLSHGRKAVPLIMPVTQQIYVRDKRFWDTIDQADTLLVAETLKELVIPRLRLTLFAHPETDSRQFQRREPASAIHYLETGRVQWGLTIGLSSLQDCLLFLLRGIVVIHGQGAFIDPYCAYVIKDEQAIGLERDTVVFVMGRGETAGVGVQERPAFQGRMKDRRAGVWKRLSKGLRRE